MIEATCDRCGKKITLRYFERGGLENPPGWDLETHHSPLKKDLDYKTFCPDCNPRIDRKVKE